MRHPRPGAKLRLEVLTTDQHGRQLGSVAQIGQTALKKAVRFFTSYDQFLTHRLEVRDADHRPVLTRPAKVFKSRVIVARPDGSEVGQIVQDNVFGKIRVNFLVNEEPIGGVQARTGGRGTSRSSTTPARRSPVFTTADNYSSSDRRSPSTPRSSRTTAASADGGSARG